MLLVRNTPEAIEAARVAAGISKRQLALRSGLVPSTLVRKLRGDFPFDVDEVAALAEALEVPVSTLLRDSNGSAA